MGVGQGTSQGSNNRRHPNQGSNTRRKSSVDITGVDFGTLSENKEPDAHVKEAMSIIEAAAHNVQASTGPVEGALPIKGGGTQPRQGGGTQPRQGTNRDSTKNRNSIKDRNSIKADRKEALRRKTIDVFDTHHIVDSVSGINGNNNVAHQGSAPRSQPPIETLKGIEKAVARQRRKSTTNLPSRQGDDSSGGGDIYSALLTLANDTGDKNDGRKHRNFDKLNKHSGNTLLSP